ncbi:MAG: hypothetical protein JW849_11815 [Phycisphaerae bacterium]|nr:hypothetical protein [Phycisphaerae bacterium]
MGFHWPLQKVLDVAETRELAIKAELFRLARDIARGQEEVRRRRSVLRLLLADLIAAPPDERLALRDMLMRCRKAEEKVVRRLREQIGAWQKQREDRTADLAKLSAKKDALNKMRREARREYQRRLDLREQQRADEVFQMGFVRRTRETIPKLCRANV